MKSTHKLCVHFLIGLLLYKPATASTLTYLATDHGIVIGTDSRGVKSGKILPSPQKKAFNIQNRIVLGSIGEAEMSVVTDDGKVLFQYTFAQLVKNVIKRCPKDVSVSALAEIVKNESGAELKGLKDFVATGKLTADRLRSVHFFARYFVLGYETGTSKVYEIHVDIDWERRLLADPMVEQLHPSTSSQPRDYYYGTFGFDDPLEIVARVGPQHYRETDVYKEMIGFGMAPNELPKLFAHQPMSTVEARNLCLAILRYEGKQHSSDVGPPYVLFTIPLPGKGGVERQVYDSAAATEHPPGPTKNKSAH